MPFEGYYVRMARLQRLAILTGGGDCPGLNAVIRAVTKSAIHEHNVEVFGVMDGFAGLLKDELRVLKSSDTSGILARGGTILGASNRDNPFRIEVSPGTYEDQSKAAIKTLEKHHIDALICVGGDGTMHVAKKFLDMGVPVIGVPKTIDNDLDATDRTFGFDTAVTTISEALDKLHTTAEAHHRIMIVETMGRYAGWLALAGGVAGGGDIILIPEIPFDLDCVVESLDRRVVQRKKYSIIVVAEGAKPVGGEMTIQKHDTKRTDPIRLGGISHRIAQALEERSPQECRVVVLGHLQRGGTPTAYDRLLGTRFGVKAVELAMEGRFGQMASLRGDQILSVTIEDAIGKLKTVPPDHALIQAARSVGTTFGDRGP